MMRNPAIRILVGSLVAALAMFAWGFVFWTVLVPAPRVFGEALDEPALSEALVTYLPVTDVYFIPEWQADRAVLESRFGTGPVATIFFRREGVDAMSPRTFALGYLQMLAACLVAAVLLHRCRSALSGFGSRVGVVLLAGLCGSVLITTSGPIWWHQPWSFHRLYLVYAAVAWLLAGCALAGLIKR